MFLQLSLSIYKFAQKSANYGEFYLMLLARSRIKNEKLATSGQFLTEIYKFST